MPVRKGSKPFRKVIGEGEFPTLLKLGTNKRYIRDVISRTVTLTGDKEGYIDIMKLKDNADFFLYQDEFVGNAENRASHKVIDKVIKKTGQDYRYEDKKNAIKELQDRKKDNITLGRKKC